MKDINKLMPKLPKNCYATISNFPMSRSEINETTKIFGYDSKWHTLFDRKDSIDIDGKTILKQNAKRYT